jgi:hypothetical protein
MRLLVIGIVAVLIYMGYHAPFTLHPHTLHTRPKIIQTLIYVLLIPLIVIGIRGGLDESTTNIGQVYFSQNQFLNHAAVNPVFSFLSSLDHQLGDGNEYQFMSDEECAALVKDVYPSQPSTLNAPLDSAALHSKEPSTLTFPAGEGTELTIDELQLAGKKRMPANDFLNGMKNIEKYSVR